MCEKQKRLDYLRGFALVASEQWEGVKVNGVTNFNFSTGGIFYIPLQQSSSPKCAAMFSRDRLRPATQKNMAGNSSEAGLGS